MILSTFLGNTGRQYEQTRHNLAWIVLQHLSSYPELRWIGKFKGEYARLDKPEALLLKPLVFMNNSGESVTAALSFFKLDPEQMIVVHDDLELPFGTIQIKKGGGAGGHNGLRSIIKLTGNPDFFRLRLGISRPPSGRDVSSWVLGRFSPDEEMHVPGYAAGAASVLEKALSEKLTAGSKIDLLN